MASVKHNDVKDLMSHSKGSTGIMNGIAVSRNYLGHWFINKERSKYVEIVPFIGRATDSSEIRPERRLSHKVIKGHEAGIGIQASYQWALPFQATVMHSVVANGWFFFSGSFCSTRTSRTLTSTRSPLGLWCRRRCRRSNFEEAAISSRLRGPRGRFLNSRPIKKNQIVSVERRRGFTADTLLPVRLEIDHNHRSCLWRRYCFLGPPDGL